MSSPTMSSTRWWNRPCSSRRLRRAHSPARPPRGQAREKRCLTRSKDVPSLECPSHACRPRSDPRTKLDASRSGALVRVRRNEKDRPKGRTDDAHADPDGRKQGVSMDRVHIALRRRRACSGAAVRGVQTRFVSQRKDSKYGAEDQAGGSNSERDESRRMVRRRRGGLRCRGLGGCRLREWGGRARLGGRRRRGARCAGRCPRGFMAGTRGWWPMARPAAGRRKPRPRGPAGSARSARR